MTSRRAGAPAEATPPSLYLPQASNVTRMEIVCSAPYQQDQEERKYTSHPYFHPGARAEDFPENVSCWNDTYPFEGIPVRLPMEYHESTNKYVALGYFCSPQCAKRWAIEHPSYNSPHQLTLLAQAYGFVQPVRPALPQVMLKKFGGPLTIEEFRSRSQDGTLHVVVQSPPFITCAMVFEERRQVQHSHAPPLSSSMPPPSLPLPMIMKQNEPMQIRGLRVPTSTPVTMSSHDDTEIYQPAPPMFDQFVEQKRQGNTNVGSTASAPRAPANRGSTMKGSAAKKPKLKATTEKTTLTTSAAVNVEAKRPSTDTKRGSLQAFMKKKQTVPTAPPH